MEYSTDEIAWAAGFFEGEGSFTLNRGQQRPVPVVYVSQVDPEPLERFARYLRLEPHGKQYREVRQGTRDIWRFRIHKYSEVQRVVDLLYPWLSPRRREQADRMLAEAGPPAYEKRVPGSDSCAYGHTEGFYAKGGRCIRCQREANARAYAKRRARISG
jgi:hypothetical protein